ncbi:hypothetical protein SYNTR_0792 [Candidatus Syntrophocurvum alkaliphilum]|uniref:Gamma-glutamylcyclotransferase AIG2-like domain-containing protein n=1 Tax=Candidatus Syntrophocurvum alkaliphilum TaxID=2293317 RepID=A0A6I6D959_9FIRM|nr:gamma-glutamylcyclotransferase family protein [Candidatus Syntrophocurvum alkaliphilum]QGT99385.1 hypothetical protein SYNTR_0792 [Candidatus Syntrophocurvum alkaliphilum]
MLNRVFVYGTLRSDMGSYELINDFVLKREVAKIRGILYDLPYGYPAVILGKGFVYGELLTLKKINVILPRLDDYEGYYGYKNKNNLYIRVKTIAQTGSEKKETYVYLWKDKNKLPLIGTKIKSGDWLKYKLG